jgi:hypothetical protein
MSKAMKSRTGIIWLSLDAHHVQDLPERLRDGPVAKLSAALVRDENMVVTTIIAPTIFQIAVKSRGHGLVHRYDTALFEFGIANNQTVVAKVFQP